MGTTKESQYLAAFGKRVAEVRHRRGLTQEQLAEKADLMPLTVSFVEQGRRWPRIITVHKIAKALNVPLDELFKGLKS
jgi:transcriptional regulator with XRE-family HTH domain